MKARRSYVESLEFESCLQDCGQIVDVSYAADESGVWCRIYDRSDQTMVYQFGRYPERCREDRLLHELQNGRIAAHTKMRRVTLT